MDEVYRGYRIALTATLHWRARITHVRGSVVGVFAEATLEEGSTICQQRARQAVDNYIEFLRTSRGRG